MRNNKMMLRKRDICIRKKTVALFLAVFVVLVLTLAASSDVSAAGKVKAHGTLTSIESDGLVIIDEKGYNVSPSVTIQNFRGESASLSSFLPSRFVYFEYEYAPHGFVIIFIKEIAQ